MTDYRTTEPRQIAGQGKEKKKRNKKKKKKFFFSFFLLFSSFSFFPPFLFPFIPLLPLPSSFFPILRHEGLKREKNFLLSHPGNLPQRAEQEHQTHHKHKTNRELRCC